MLLCNCLSGHLFGILLTMSDWRSDWGQLKKRWLCFITQEILKDLCSVKRRESNAFLFYEMRSIPCSIETSRYINAPQKNIEPQRTDHNNCAGTARSSDDPLAKSRSLWLITGRRSFSSLIGIICPASFLTWPYNPFQTTTPPQIGTQGVTSKSGERAIKLDPCKKKTYWGRNGIEGKNLMRTLCLNLYIIPQYEKWSSILGWISWAPGGTGRQSFT